MTLLPIKDFRFGIEHEFPAVDGDDRFCDFSNSMFDEFDRVISELPITESDYASLRVGDLGIKNKRWYIEGFERFDDQGGYLRTDPKGFEIRTPICGSLDEVLSTLGADIEHWERVAARHGFRSARTALNPFRSEYVPEPPLNEWEVADRQTPEEQTAHIHMLTYGPDISFSHPDLTTEETLDIGKKLTFYSPYIVPFSFSSPFYEGDLWGGLSRRTYYRTGARPSVLVFVEHDHQITPSFPTLTDKARIPAEVGRIEFKAFDCPRDVGLFRSLGALLVGLALDTTLEGRAPVPDGALHKLSATEGFDSDLVCNEAATVVSAARAALPGRFGELLAPLEAMLASRTTPAHAMIDSYLETGDIMRAIG